MRRRNGKMVPRLGSALGCLVFGLFLASALAAQGPSDQAGVNKLELPNGRTFHATANPVHNQRDLPVSGSDLTLHVWKEELPSGRMQSFYAVSRGGTEMLGRVRATDHQVRLRHFSFDPLVSGAPGLSLAMSARSKSRLHLVQLEAPPLPEMRRAITGAGGKVLRFLTDHTFIVDMTPEVRARVDGLGFVRWIGPYHPAFRVEKAVRDAIDGLTDSLEAERYSIFLAERFVTQGEVKRKIEALGGVVELIESGGWRVEAELSQDQLLEVAHFDEVQFIDRWGGPGETDMAKVREAGGGNYVETVAGYTGQGVRGEVFDTELRTGHVEWANAPVVHSPRANNCSTPHGTSAYSNNFAQGINSSARGMLPDGQGIFFCHADSSQFGGSISRYTANAELIAPAGPYRAVFQTSSVGSARTTSYTTISAETDDYLFQHQILSTQSQSNAGNQNSRPQAWAKNIVSVGGIDSNATAARCNDTTSNASTGPAQDGRIKPDLAFFYDSIFSATNGSNSSYGNFCCTSSATPQTSGHFGIFFQMWHDGVWAGHGGGVDVFDSRPKMSTAKAMMINHAFRYDWTNPGSCSFGGLNRNRQGWGTADLRRLLDRASVTRIIDETDILQPLETKAYTVSVTAAATELNVTMVYIDPMGTVGAAEHRINDLSLRVTAPDSTRYWGNNGLTSGNWSTPGGSSNTVDTVENVFIEDPTPGIWTVEVIGDEIVQDSHVETGAVDADFALVISGGSTVINGRPFVTITSPTNGSSSTLGESVTFVGTATDPEEGDLTGILSWASSIDDTIGSGGSFSTSSLSEGNHTITASATDSGGLTGSATVTIRVTSPGGCSHGTGFESGAGGWTNGADTCTTGSFIVGTPDATAWQVGGGNPGQAFFTQNNGGGLGTDDVDGGTCEALSPIVSCAGEAAVEVSLDYYHGQRDAGDDPNDSFTIEVLNDDTVVDTLVSIGDVTHNAQWTSVSTTVVSPGDLQIRVRATDAAATGDIVEAGIDNVSITPTTVANCAAEVDFSSGAEGWTNSGSSTCTTGSFVVGTPDEVVDGSVTTQVGGDHTTGSGNAFFSADNATSAGQDDVDNGVCIVTSPVYAVSEASDVSVWYYHGQRDAGDDPGGDFFLLEISTDGGSSWSTMASFGDVTSNAVWTEATASASAGDDVQFRIQVSDGSGPGDLVEAGVDDISICPQ